MRRRPVTYYMLIVAGLLLMVDATFRVTGWLGAQGRPGESLVLGLALWMLAGIWWWKSRIRK